MKWQDELNSSNLPFLEACHGVFLNYCWKTGGLDKEGSLLPDNLANSLASLPNNRLSSEVRYSWHT